MLLREKLGRSTRTERFTGARYSVCRRAKLDRQPIGSLPATDEYHRNNHEHRNWPAYTENDFRPPAETLGQLQSPDRRTGNGRTGRCGQARTRKVHSAGVRMGYAKGSGLMSGGMGKDAPELAIRIRRAAFNQALTDTNLNAIGPILAQNAILIAGTDSSIISGRKAQLLAWKREFAASDRTIYTRLTERVEASAVAPLAFEYGRWQGISVSGQHLASGTYVAKWREVAADWMLEAETFLTLA